MGKVIGVVLALLIVVVGIYIAASSSVNFQKFSGSATNFAKEAFTPYGSTSTVSGVSSSADLPSYLRGTSADPEWRAAHSGTGSNSGSSSGSGSGSGSTAGSGSASVPRATVNPKDVPAGYTIYSLSPHFKQVRIKNIAAGSSSNTNSGAVTLEANFSGSGVIDITGWWLKANRASQFIPAATRIYMPILQLPQSDILLRRGETVQIYPNWNPLGRNFLVNKCIGYLGSEFSITPALPDECPAVNRKDIITFTGVCQDYILGLKSCEKASPTAPVPPDDYACRSYLSSINYQGCVTRHISDADFLGKDWRVWVGRSFLDARHDRVLLFDKTGLIVDEYIY